MKKFICELSVVCGSRACGHGRPHRCVSFEGLPAVFSDTPIEKGRDCSNYACSLGRTIFQGCNPVCIEIEVDDEDQSQTKDVEDQDSSP